VTEEQSTLIANFRYGVIAPMVVQPLARGEQARMLRGLAGREYNIPFSASTRIHERTLERWLRAYRKGGLEALRPKRRADSGSSRTVPEAALEKAKALKKEVPQRSVPQIITMLEMAGEVEKGQLKESTLRRHLGPVEKTSSRRPKAHRRFESPHRNHTWQGDCHHTLYLPDPENKGKNRQAYLIAFIDDYSRYVVHAEYYFEERRPKLEDCLKKAILKFGVPSRLYCDNGAIYSGPHLERIAGELGFHLIHSRPGMPQGRGKIEKFFQYVDRSFKPEAYALIASGKLCTLEELNNYFWAWLEVYHQKPHGSLKKTPKERFEEGQTPLRKLDPLRVRQSFLWQEKRRVDKTGCFTLDGNTYEVSAALVRRQITVRYDPYDLSVIQVFYGGEAYPDAEPLDLRKPRHRDLGQVSRTPTITTNLNFLELAKRQYDEELRKRLGAMRFPCPKEEETAK
jgi:putative transposase